MSTRVLPGACDGTESRPGRGVSHCAPAQGSVPFNHRLPLWDGVRLPASCRGLFVWTTASKKLTALAPRHVHVPCAKDRAAGTEVE